MDIPTDLSISEAYSTDAIGGDTDLAHTLFKAGYSSSHALIQKARRLGRDGEMDGSLL